MNLVELLRQHWSEYVARAGGAGKIPAPHWRAVEAVPGCRTSRLGGHAHRCADCGGEHYAYHSCNHRSCPRCGGYDQKLWALRQQVRLLPVPYFMLTFTVPEELRAFFLRYEDLAYGLLFTAAQSALKELFAGPKYFGADHGSIAVLHTWTRQMQFHPHLHMIVPAVAFDPQTCEVFRPKNPDFLLPHAPLARAYRDAFYRHLGDKHPGLLEVIDPEVFRMKWNLNIRAVGRGIKALRYLAAYVKKTAFDESRLDGYDEQGRVRFWWTPSSEKKPRLMTLEPLEFIRRWLLHVLPKGFRRVRQYGFLAPAARKSYRRLRFLLGGAGLMEPVLEQTPMLCPKCGGIIERMTKILPARGPPLSLGLIQP